MFSDIYITMLGIGKIFVSQIKEHLQKNRIEKKTARTPSIQHPQSIRHNTTCVHEIEKNHYVDILQHTHARD